MKRSTAVLNRSALAATLVGFLATGASAQAGVAGVDYGGGALQEVSARIWFDRGHEPLVDRGDRVRIYYRTDRDAYVAVFRIDTNGSTHLVYPAAPSDPHYVRGGRDYRLFLRGSSYWHVDDAPGLGYYFIVASPVPFDFSLFDYAQYGRSWDLTHVGSTVYSDPYVAMDDYVAALLPRWSEIPYGLDFATYNVGRQRYDYPRFVCYDCHGFRSYASWNPYHYACTSFRIVIYNDPYYYPVYRYRGQKVVFVRPPVFRSPRFAFKERVRGETARPLIATRATSPPVIDRRAVPRSPVVRRGQAGGERGTITPDRRAQPRDAVPGTGTRRATPRADDGGTRVPTRRVDPTTGTTGDPIGTTPTRRAIPRASGDDRSPPRRVVPGRAGGDDVSPTRRARPEDDDGRGIVVTPSRPDREAGEGGARPSDRNAARRGTTVLDRSGSAGTRPTRAVPAAPERPSRGRPVLQPRSPERSAPTTRGSTGSERAVPSRPTTSRGRVIPSRTPTTSNGRAAPSRTPTSSRGRVVPSRAPTPTGGRAVPSRTPTRSPGARARTGSGSRTTPTRLRPRSGGASASSTGGGATSRATPTRVRPRTGSASSSAGGRATGRATPTRVRSGSGGGSAPARSTPARVRSRTGGSSASGRSVPTRVKPRTGTSGRSSGRPPVRVRPRTGGGG